MINQFSRTELLLGEEAMAKLAESKVAIFGIGGVGGYVAEALARSGIGSLTLIDDDKVSLTNINRQIIATQSTIGRYKVTVMEERILDINPQAEIITHKVFYTPETAAHFPLEVYSYVVDAVDTVSAKLELAMRAQAAGVPLISSMGAGNKLDPTRFEVVDIYQTSIDPLSRVMRRELKKRGIEKLKVVYSPEMPITPVDALNFQEQEKGYASGVLRSGKPKKSVPGSTAFVPSVVGLIIASEVVKDLIAYHGS